MTVEEWLVEVAMGVGENDSSSRSSESTQAEPKTDPGEDIAEGEGVRVVRVEGEENAGVADEDATGVGCWFCCRRRRFASRRMRSGELTCGARSCEFCCT